MSERNFETIVEGAFYRMANGEVVGPANRRHDRSNEAKSPWEVGNRTYTQDGYCHYSKQEFKYNLIARVNQDGTPWVEPVEPATEPEKRLPQPGEKWLTRGGFVATVKARDEVSDFHNRYLSGVVLLDGGEITARWLDDGAVYSTWVQPCDLVEYIGPIEQKADPPSHLVVNATTSVSIESLSNSGLLEMALRGERGEEQQRIAREVAKLGAMLLRKNSDYGSSAWKRPILAPHIKPGDSILVRMSDKIERILQLATKAPEVAEEKIEQTIDDFVGYWILAKAAPVSERKQ